VKREKGKGKKRGHAYVGEGEKHDFTWSPSGDIARGGKKRGDSDLAIPKRERSQSSKKKCKGDSKEWVFPEQKDTGCFVEGINEFSEK